MKTVVNQQFQRFKHIIFLVFILYSCNYYSSVRFSKKVFISNYAYDEAQKDGKIKHGLDQYRILDKEVKSYPISGDSKTYQFHFKRYFARIFSLSPISAINNRGVEYAQKGRFKEAEILFKEAIKEDKNFAPAYNNLGIIFELFGYGEEAFKMYSKACIMDSDNEYYRNNFLFFYEKKKLH